MKKKIILLLVLVLILIMAFSSLAYGASDIKVYLDDKEIALSTSPVIIDGTTMLPFRGVFEALGATVSWDPTTKMITGTKGNTTIKLGIGYYNALVNGRTVDLSVSPRIINNVTMVPVRFVSESLGYDVNYDSNTKIIYITSNIEVSRGTWTDNVFTNEFSDLKFTLPDGWDKATDEEMAAIADVDIDELTNMKSQVIYDMMCEDPQTASRILVDYENLSLSIGGTKYTEEEYLDAGTDLLSELLADYTLTFGEYEKETICDNTYTSLKVNLKSSDNSMIQTYFVRKYGNYMIVIIVTTSEDESIDSIMPNFS